MSAKANRFKFDEVDCNTLIPEELYHEGMGFVIWYRVPICEPGVLASGLCDDFPEDYYTHFQKVPEIKSQIKLIDQEFMVISTRFTNKKL